MGGAQLPPYADREGAAGYRRQPIRGWVVRLNGTEKFHKEIYPYLSDQKFSSLDKAKIILKFVGKLIAKDFRDCRVRL
jgi:hypothetical protein